MPGLLFYLPVVNMPCKKASCVELARWGNQISCKKMSERGTCMIWATMAMQEGYWTPFLHDGAAISHARRCPAIQVVRPGGCWPYKKASGSGTCMTTDRK